MPLDMPNWPLEDYGFDETGFDPLEFCDGRDEAATAVIAWLDAQPQDGWLHYVRQTEFDPDFHTATVAAWMAEAPALEPAVAQLLFWKMSRGRYPYFAAEDIREETDRRYPELARTLRLLARRLAEGDLAEPALRLTAAELRPHVRGFDREARIARRRGWTPSAAPFDLPAALRRPRPGRAASVPPRFSAPAARRAAGVMMLFDGFCLADIRLSARGEAMSAARSQWVQAVSRAALYTGALAAGLILPHLA